MRRLAPSYARMFLLGYRHFRPMSNSCTHLVAQAVSAIAETSTTLPIRWGRLPLVGLSSVNL